MNARTSARRAPLASIVAVALGAVVGAGACSAAPDSASYTVTSEALRGSFTNGHVAAALGMGCGTLDCHGQQGRNLRIYSQYGLRRSPSDRPGDNPITQAEIDEDFRSVAGLEPEIFNLVVESGGAEPERLTLIRKGRGTEAHKGHAAMKPGDALDGCLTAWLTGADPATFVAKCDEAAAPPNLTP